MKIVLPWPDRRLFPNFKRANHWRTYRSAEQQARRDGAGLAYVAAGRCLPELRGAFSGTEKIGYRVTFYPPDRRRRDDDGMIGAIKNYRDGICDALGFDDSRLCPQYLFANPSKPGRVVIELSLSPVGFGENAKFFTPSAPDAVNGLPPEPPEAAT